MKQELEAAPFEIGERLAYIGDNSIQAPSPDVQELVDILLTAGMIGRVIRSEPGWIDPVSGKTQRAHCLIKFDNGYEFIIYSHNKSKFRGVE